MGRQLAPGTLAIATQGGKGYDLSEKSGQPAVNPRLQNHNKSGIAYRGKAMMGKPLVITLGQLLSLAALVLVVGLVIWLWRRQQKQTTPPAFLDGLSDAGQPLQEGQLRAEIQSLRAQVSRLGQEVEALKASRTGTPQQANYTQAIEMARQGQPVSEVANRCGISRAEAELIVAMHGGQGNT